MSSATFRARVGEGAALINLRRPLHAGQSEEGAMLLLPFPLRRGPILLQALFHREPQGHHGAVQSFLVDENGLGSVMHGHLLKAPHESAVVVAHRDCLRPVSAPRVRHKNRNDVESMPVYMSSM